MWIWHDFIKCGLIKMFIQEGSSELNCWGVEKAADGDVRVSTQRFSLCASPNLHPQLFFKVVMWQFPFCKPPCKCTREVGSVLTPKTCHQARPRQTSQPSSRLHEAQLVWAAWLHLLCLHPSCWSHRNHNRAVMSSKESRACHVSGTRMEDQQGRVERVAWPWMWCKESRTTDPDVDNVDWGWVLVQTNLFKSGIHWGHLAQDSTKKYLRKRL